MLSKTAIWTILAVVVVGASVILYIFLSQSEFSPGTADLAPNTKQFGEVDDSIPQPTGNVDDLAEEMTNAIAEETRLTETDEESAIINEELKALDELGQSYDENEF